MRRTLLGIIAILVFAGIMPTTVASAADQQRFRFYEGTTSEGGRLMMSVAVRDGVPYLNVLVIDGPYTCEDGSQGEFAGGGYGWWPSDYVGPIIANEPFDVSGHAGESAFTLAGRLGHFRGSGTITYLRAALTADEQSAQVCTFGGGAWSVERSGTSSFSLEPTMRVDGEGGQTVAGFRVATSRDSAVIAQAQTAAIRHYRGRTEQDRAMSVRTSRTDSGIALLHVKLGFSLACDDGGDIEGAVWPVAYLDPDLTHVMPYGRLDLDIAPSVGGIALHLHGDLDGHLGSGTLSMIWPWLTEDLQAQRCQTGDHTWSLWRTDAGF